MSDSGSSIILKNFGAVAGKPSRLRRLVVAIGRRGEGLCEKKYRLGVYKYDSALNIHRARGKISMMVL